MYIIQFSRRLFKNPIAKKKKKKRKNPSLTLKIYTLYIDTVKLIEGYKSYRLKL